MSEAQAPLPAELDRAYEALVKSHRAAFLRLARRLAKDPEDAEDLLQETLVDAYRAFGRFRAESHFYSWVARIMTNNYLDRIRRRQCALVSLDAPAEEAEPLELPDDSANPERLLLREQFDQPLQSALDALQPLHRATVLLCDIEGATYEEAARVEACPVGTIRSRLHRAHRYLQRFLANVTGTAQPDAAQGRSHPHSRREFLRFSTAAVAGATLPQIAMADDAAPAGEPIRVRVWADGDACRTLYPEGLAAALAEGLRLDCQVEVVFASASEPGQGLSDAALRQTDVLVWWSDGPHDALRDDRAAAIARRVREEGMGLIVAHAAPGPKPLRTLLGTSCRWDEGCHADGSAVEVRVTAPRHPIARGVSGFRIEAAGRCEGTLDVPKPDILVFDGAYPGTGRTAAQGMVWKIGAGRVFSFQPGHPQSPVFHHEEVRQILRNAVRWCAGR
jgi:RNA polymerase sigma factor (sigma-70 family)